MRCNFQAIVPATKWPRWLCKNYRERESLADFVEETAGHFVVPDCPKCAGNLKPDVEFFREG